MSKCRNCVVIPVSDVRSGSCGAPVTTALTCVVVSAPLSGHTGGGGGRKREQTVLQKRNYSCCHPEFSLFAPRRMADGSRLVPTRWKPAKKRRGAFRAPRKFRSLPCREINASGQRRAFVSRRLLFCGTTSRLFAAVKCTRGTKRDNTSS